MSDYDPTDIEQQDQDRAYSESVSKLITKNESADLKWLMSGPHGRRAMCRLLIETGVLRPVFSPNAMQMAFNEGGRNVGINLRAKLEALCPAEYEIMMKEYYDRANASTRSTIQI